MTEYLAHIFVKTMKMVKNDKKLLEEVMEKTKAYIEKACPSASEVKWDLCADGVVGGSNVVITVRTTDPKDTVAEVNRAIKKLYKIGGIQNIRT